MPYQLFEFTTLVNYPPLFVNLLQQKNSFANPTPIEPKFPPTHSLSTLVLEGLFFIQPLPPFTTIASHDIKPPHPTNSLIGVKAPPSLEVPSLSLAQVAMEPHSNILVLPSAKILYLVPIDGPTPTPIEVSKPLLVEVLVSPFVQARAPPIHKVSIPSSTEVPPISPIMDVCKEAKESSNTLLQKSYK